MVARRLVCFALLLASALLGTTGCRYMTNRYYDFRDLAHVAVGVTSENPVSGMMPPALGLYVEATEFLNLGAITHHGPVAEMDMRGTGVYYEDRTRLGLLWWQAIHINQDYRDACYMNYFKEADTMWARWMEDPMMTFLDAPAKSLNYSHWRHDLQYGPLLFHRGWHYWEYIGAEAAICDPFLTHLGLTLRLGFDISEASDFLLGWFNVDFKRDDLCQPMFEEKRSGKRVTARSSVTSTYESTTAAPGELDELRRKNQELEAELAKYKGRLNEVEGGIEFVLPEHVLFSTGSNQLTPGGKQLLDQIVARISSEYAGHEIMIEGHTDDRPIVHSRKLWKSNWELGAGRALAVLHYMIDVKGLPKQNFAAITYADNKPVASNADAAGRQQNRRSVVVLRARKS